MSCGTRIFSWCSALVSLTMSVSAQAGVEVIVSAPPPPRSVVVSPPGYSRCYTVEPGYYNGNWHHSQKICEYGGARGFRLWINGAWQCGNYRTGGVCTRWRWISSHWASSHDVELYRRPSQRGYYRGNSHSHTDRQGFSPSHEHGYGTEFQRGRQHNAGVGHGHRAGVENVHNVGGEHERKQGVENRHTHR